MILRVRTNLGTTKITIENDQTATIQELLKIIIDKLNISNLTQNLVLTYDLAGERPIPVRSGQQSLSEVGLKHGDEVFIKGKFEEVIVEKSYVNEQHELVKAGKSLRLIEELQSDEKEGDELRLEKPVATNSTDLKDDSKSALPARSEVNPTADSSLKSSAISSSPQVNLPSSTNAPLIPTAPPTNHPPPRAPIPAYYDANGSPIKSEGDRREMYGVEGDEDGVRAPDEVQKMRLIDFPSPSRDFTPAETERLNQYRQQLREAGLKEYDIETMLQEMKDEMLAERLRRQMSMEDRLSYQQYTTLDQLEQLLANHRRPPPFTTNTRSSATSIYRPDYQRNTANPIRATNAAAVGGGHKRKLIDEFKLNNDDAVPLLQSKTTKQTKQTTSTTTKPPNRLQGAGERIVRNSFDSEENHTTGATAANSRKKPQNTFNTPHLSTATAEDHRQIIDLVGDDGNDTGKGPSEPPSSLLRSGYQPLSSYRGQKSNDPWTSTSNSHSISRQTTSSSSTARRGETASHSKKDEAVEVDEDAAFEEMMRRAIEESKRESEMKAAKINPKAESKPSASSLLPTPSSSISSAVMRQRGELSSHTTTLRAKSASSNTNNSTNNARSGAATISSTAKIRDGAIDRKAPPVKLERQSSAKAASSGSNKVKEDELEEMMRLQQQLDEEAARELQESEDLAFAKYHERDGSEDFNALGLGGDRESLRNALHYNDPLPAAMNQRMNAGLTSDLIELMRMRTAGITSELREDRLFPLPSTHGEDFFGSTRNIDTARVVSEGRGGSGGVGSGGYYDEEDELLARALQNSLNEK